MKTVTSSVITSFPLKHKKHEVELFIYYVDGVYGATVEFVCRKTGTVFRNDDDVDGDDEKVNDESENDEVDDDEDIEIGRKIVKRCFN